MNGDVRRDLDQKAPLDIGGAALDCLAVGEPGADTAIPPAPEATTDMWTAHGLALDLASQGRKFIPLWGMGRDCRNLYENWTSEEFRRYLASDDPEVCNCPLKVECPTPGVHPIKNLTVEDATSDVSVMMRWKVLGKGWIGEVLEGDSIVVLEAPIGYRSSAWGMTLKARSTPRSAPAPDRTRASTTASLRPQGDLRLSTSLYSTAHAWALWWAERGFKVFRVCGIRDVNGVLVGDCWTDRWGRRSCRHDKPGKSPFVESWKGKSTTDRAIIDRWFRESPNANYAVVIGPGYVVLDFDTPDADHDWRDGHQEVAALGELPLTLTFQTGSGGEHRLFRTEHDDGNKLPAFEGLHMKGIVDVKANGMGYIIGTGSRHHSGSFYMCADPCAEIARAPEWLYDDGAPRRRGKRGRSEREVLVEAGYALRDAYVEDPDAMLSGPSFHLLGLGKADGTERYEDDDQSAVTFRIVMGAIRVNYPLEQLFGLLCRSDSLGGLGLRKRIKDNGQEAGQEWFDGMVNTVFFYLATNRASVRKLRAEAKRAKFTRTTYVGRNGKPGSCNASSIQKVLSAVLDIASDRSTLDPMVGAQSQLPTKTGLTANTCRKAMQALEALGWISTPVHVSSPTGEQYAYTYRLLTDPTSRINPPGIASKPKKQEKRTTNRGSSTAPTVTS